MGAGSSLVGIKEGETYTVHDLWLGVFLRSGNDAVHVLSAMNGGVAQDRQGDERRTPRSSRPSTRTWSAPTATTPRARSPRAYDLTLFARSGLQKKDFREYCSTVAAQFPGETTKDKKGKTVREPSRSRTPTGC